MSQRALFLLQQMQSLGAALAPLCMLCMLQPPTPGLLPLRIPGTDTTIPPQVLLASASKDARRFTALVSDFGLR